MSVASNKAEKEQISDFAAKMGFRFYSYAQQAFAACADNDFETYERIKALDESHKTAPKVINSCSCDDCLHPGSAGNSGVGNIGDKKQGQTSETTILVGPGY